MGIIAKKNSKDIQYEKYMMLFKLKKIRVKPEVVDVTGCMITLPHSAPGGPCKLKWTPKIWDLSFKMRVLQVQLQTKNIQNRLFNMILGDSACVYTTSEMQQMGGSKSHQQNY